MALSDITDGRMKMKEKILVTGAAGFIGFHVSKKLLDNNYNVVGLDNLNDYYSVELKNSRVEILNKYPDFKFQKIDLKDKHDLEKLFDMNSFQYVIHLGAQAGVRYSIENPDVYIESNIVGFLHILELSKSYKVKHLIYASSSSVYGGNTKIPFSVEDRVDNPVSLYAATKKSNELMAYSYSHLFRLPTTGVRFFTVYGPYGRPDMAYFKFTKNILEGKNIDVYNYGKMARDFTYIDDIVEGIFRLLKKPSDEEVPYNLFNIGCGNPVELMDFIKIIEDKLNKKAKINFMDMQPGDVVTTYADISKLRSYIDYNPETTFEKGIEVFLKWYKSFYL